MSSIVLDDSVYLLTDKGRVALAPDLMAALQESLGPIKERRRA